MTVALVANIARPINSAVSKAFSSDSYGKLDAYGKLGAWSPTSLFANSEQGAWYDPSDLTTMFQDRAGTTPVTADGQPVGKRLDKSGRGNHAVAPSDAARPLYKTDGTYHWLQYDGVDDSLSTAAINFTATDKITTFAGLSNSSKTSAQLLYETSANVGSNNGSFGQFSPIDANQDNMLLATNGTVQFGGGYLSTGIGVNTPLITSCLFDNAGATTEDQVKPRVNGVLKTMVLKQTTSPGNYGTYPLNIGSRNGDSFRLNGRIYSLIILGRLATTQEITDTETWVAAKTGVTL